jgi:hypothetical protein
MRTGRNECQQQQQHQLPPAERVTPTEQQLSSLAGAHVAHQRGQQAVALAQALHRQRTHLSAWTAAHRDQLKSRCSLQRRAGGQAGRQRDPVVAAVAARSWVVAGDARRRLTTAQGEHSMHRQVPGGSQQGGDMCTWPQRPGSIVGCMPRRPQLPPLLLLCPLEAAAATVGCHHACGWAGKEASASTLDWRRPGVSLTSRV